MKFYRGRLFDHVQLVVSNLEASRRFYGAVIASLGLPVQVVDGPGFFYADDLFVSQGPKGISRVHIAFQASGRESVARFHSAALEAGGVDNGAPGERRYHPGYYAAYALDPDGNNVEAVFHGPADRSADAVVITPAGQSPGGNHA
jgi:catechol 2,3-dioxygenase-like lactoylglutathione lyase family enzyme